MQRMLPLLIICMVFSLVTNAQFSRYIIKFKDKGTNPFSISNPSQYLTQRAIQRRTRYNIAIDSTDLPITPRYIDSLRAAGAVSILNSSRWLNQVLIKTSDATALAKINSLPFVLSTNPIAPLVQATQTSNNKFGVTEQNTGSFSPSEPDNLLDVYNYGRSNGQVKIHKGEFLHNHGFRGEGMHMAMLDAGFLNYLTLRPFDSIRLNNQVLGTWDFVANEASVNEDDKHGMHCLSTIAANVPGVFIGTSPKTSFYLYRTEDVASEYPVEEQNWAAGVERADSLGVDICSTSLGYFQFDNSIFNYTYNDLNGNTTISVRAADLAAKKGMLMVVALGNEGNNIWHYLISPADGDSVMAVGAVDTLGNVASFSSYGPSSDGQVKPNVASVGLNAIVANSTNGAPAYGNGTSFACPNMAGITSCLWQAFPEINNMGIINAMQISATKAANPDDRVGYGIPDAKKAFVYLIKQLYTQQGSLNGCNANIMFGVKSDSTMSISIERKLSTETNYSVIVTKQGLGSFGLQNYIFPDDLSSSPAGVVQYRLRMDIATDTTFYLDSLSVNLPNCAGTVATNNILIAPNPVIDNLSITFSRITATKYEILVYNASGQKIYRVSGQQAAGTGTVLVPMKSLSSGVYYVTVFIDNKKMATKEILRR